LGTWGRESDIGEGSREKALLRQEKEHNGVEEKKLQEEHNRGRFPSVSVC
jgi:hypothetical protein